MNSKFKQFINGGFPALLQHAATLLVAIVATIVAVTLLYADVRATEEETEDNRARVEAIERSINEVTTQQKLLIQRFDIEQEANKEFRDKTSNALDKILDRLPRRERPVR